MPPKRRAEADAKIVTPSKRAKKAQAAEESTAPAQESPLKTKRSKKPSTDIKDQVEDSTPLERPAIESSNSIKKGRTKKAATKASTSTDQEQVGVATEDPPKKEKTTKAIARKKKKVEIEEDEQSDSDEDVKETDKVAKKAPTKRKSKAEKAAEAKASAMPVRARTPNLRMFVGAHVSSGGGVQNSVTNAVYIGGNAFALFLKNQRRWETPVLNDEHRDEFKHLCSHHNFAANKHVLPHGSYLVNLAQSEKEKADQAYDSFLDDVKRCEALGIKLYNFHPGNTGSQPRHEAISRIAQQLNKAIKATSTVIPVLETMAGGGNVIGSTFEDLRDIISEVEDKTRVGVCIDTCHIFAAGYDIRTPETFKATMDKFDSIIGMKYLRAFHMNDSKAPLGSHRDLHQNIGVGFLGLRAFHSVMNDSRFEDLPMVLETPVHGYNTWAGEIKLLESLIGMDATSQEFITQERYLFAQGATERESHQAQDDKKIEKSKKKAANAEKKRKKQAEKDEKLDDESD